MNHPTITKMLIDKHIEKTRNIFSYGHLSYSRIRTKTDIRDFITYISDKFKRYDIDTYFIEQKDNKVILVIYTGPIMSVEEIVFNKDDVIVDGILTDINERYGFK